MAEAIKQAIKQAAEEVAKTMVVAITEISKRGRSVTGTRQANTEECMRGRAGRESSMYCIYYWQDKT